MKRLLQVFILGVCAALVLGAPSTAKAADTFGDANTAYERGDYDQARRMYEKLIERGVVNERVFYNLGNSYYRIGELGIAIYNYERSLAVDPGFVDARYNLGVARDAVTARLGDRLDAAEDRGTMWRLVYHYTLGELAIALIVINALFFSLLLALRFMGDGLRRTALWVLCAFVGGALTVCAGMTVAQVYALETVTEAVVIADDVVLREGASDDRAERGQLHGGLRVEVVSKRLGWSRVRLANGVEGWISSRHLRTLEVGK